MKTKMETMIDASKLFSHSEKIARALPVLFRIAELECKRGNRVGMEVGAMRERILIALLMYVYKKENVSFPETNLYEADVYLFGTPLSIKTKTGKGYAGVKLIWTMDWKRVDSFCKNFIPKCDLLYVNIQWNNEGIFSFVSVETQKEVFDELKGDYIKKPRRGTNARGVELSARALKQLLAHPSTLLLPIHWTYEKTLLTEKDRLYLRWVDLWETL